MINIFKEIKRIDNSLVEIRETLSKLNSRTLKPDIAYLKARLSEYVEEPEPKTIYAGTEDNVEFFKQIAETFGINKDSYSIELVDGEYEIIID